MRICAVACVKDSHEILAMSIKHLALNGIEDFYIYDHGSEPAMSSFLPLAFPSDSIRLWILRKDTPGFFQQEMAYALTQLALQDGFDVSLAFDADEFWCSTVEGHSLAHQIQLELASGIDALRIPVINYAQHTDVEDFHDDALLECKYSVVPHVDPTRHPRDQVEAGIPFVAMPFLSKVIARLSRGIQYTEGQHDIIKAEGQARIVPAAGITVRHLPLPSRNHVKLKREHGRRRISAGYSAETGWQAQSLAYKTDEELDAYWENNSWRSAEGRPAMIGAYGGLVRDDGLVEIGQRLAQGAAGGSPMAFTEISAARLERVIEQLVDYAGRSERKIESIALERDRAITMGRSARNVFRDLFRLLKPMEKRLRTFRKACLGQPR